MGKVYRKNRKSLIIVTVVVFLSMFFLKFASAQTLEGKKIIGGHGHAMPNTYILRKYINEMKRAPLDGVFVHVNRNDFASKDKLRELRPLRWFKPPAVTIDDFSIALGNLANTDMGHFKHNILWCGGLRSFGANWFDDTRWKNLILNNARVLAEVYKRGNFEAVWFDVEVGGNPPGGLLTWKGTSREKRHSFKDYAKKVRQRGKELMEAFVSVKPDFKLMISHSYGSIMKGLYGRSRAALSEMPYGLLPYFLDGLLEGCGAKGQLIESGETTYGIMTYAGFKAWRDYDQYAAETLSQVPELLKKNYHHANAIWPDFRSDSNGWNEDSLNKNHLSPERMKHAFHNAMAASDEFVWTWSWHTHWWPNRSPQPTGYNQYKPEPASCKHVFSKPYLIALADSHGQMSLAWNPGDTSEKGYPLPKYNTDKIFSEVEKKYKTVLDLSKDWLFHKADSSNPAAWDWGIPLYTYGDTINRVYDWHPIKLGKYWENQGIKLDGTGVYRTSFRLPAGTSKKRVYAAIAGVSGKATMYIASKGSRPKSVGRTEGNTLMLFDITDAVDFHGDNFLSIYVTSLKGPGGIYGDVRILAREKGKAAYIQIRGKETGKWFHWMKRSQKPYKSMNELLPENTVEARLRVPDEPPLTARLSCTTANNGWELSFQPKSVGFNRPKKWLTCANTGTEWHTYRVVTTREGEYYTYTLFIDGKEKLKYNSAPIKSKKPRVSSVSIGVGWGWKNIAPIKMDLEYIRWANRPFTPEDEKVALANAPEAQQRKDIFWDYSYEADIMPDADGWKWWYDHDPRPYTRIVYFNENVDLNNATKLAPLYNWEQGKGGKLVLRDVPRLNAKGEIHGKVISGKFNAKGNSFVAKVMLLPSKEAHWSWPAVTVTNLKIKDWRPYSGLGIVFHNPTNKVEQVGLCIRDADKNSWECSENLGPGGTKVLSATIEKLQSKLLLSDIAYVTIWTKRPKTIQTFLVSPIYLVKK